jgi:HK97 family phage portal protein
MDDFDRSVRERIQQSGTASKMDVNEEKALRYITVYSCARVLSEALASLPLFVYKERTSGRGADKARDHPVYSLLHDLPNDEMTSMSWRESQMGHHVISGNNYSLITLNGRGEVVDLYPVDWNQMEPTRNKEGKLVYELNDRGKVEIYPAEKVFHVPGWGFDGIKGYSPIRMASEAIGMGMAATEFVARFYGQGMNIGSVLEHPEALSDTAHNRLREWLEAKGSGLANSWRPLILEEGMKFNRIPMPLADAQFIETRKLNRDELCGLFRVPPHMVANMENATFSNIEHQDLSFVKHTLLPYIQRWEQVINWKLFTPKEREQGYYAKFNVEGLLRGDYKSRQEGLAIQRQNGVINANDWLAKEDENPIEGRAGEVYLVNGNMTPTDLANGKPSKQSTSTEGGED